MSGIKFIAHNGPAVRARMVAKPTQLFANAIYRDADGMYCTNGHLAPAIAPVYSSAVTQVFLARIHFKFPRDAT